MSEHHDVLIVGAGISGIGAACHLQNELPGLSYAILEGREANPAAPGTCSATRGSARTPTCTRSAIGSGRGPRPRRSPTGRRSFDYVRDTAREHGVDERIRFGHRVVAAEWSTAEARWSVEVERGPERERSTFTCGFLLACCGYFRYERGYCPSSRGWRRYRGEARFNPNTGPRISTTRASAWL